MKTMGCRKQKKTFFLLFKSKYFKGVLEPPPKYIKYKI